MPRKPNPPPDDSQQSRRFIETAREIGADESGEAFEHAFKHLVQTKSKPKMTKLAPQHAKRRAKH